MFDFAPHAQRLMGVFGGPATYTPPSGAPISCRVQLERDVVFAPGDFETTVSEGHTVATLRIAEVGVPVVGAVIVQDGETFTIHRLIGNDGHFAKVVVR